jgi:hypothetical protein
MFAYEQEVRIIRIDDQQDAADPTRGRCLPWDLDKNVEFIWVHPDADPSFMATVSAVVEQYAPSLKDRVDWSVMREEPPA